MIVPTRNRPDRLARCLGALAAARSQLEFLVYVCDSSAPGSASEVERLCSQHEFVRLVRHTRDGASAARNVGTNACPCELIVNVDDDVYVAPDAIDELVRVYRALGEPAVVAGAVGWSHWRSRPLVMRSIGYARDARPGEAIEFLVSALMLYPRDLALELPWNERLWPYDDRYVSLIWRAAGARLVVADSAGAEHDETHTRYPVRHEADRIYVNLLDAAFVTRSLRRVLGFELLGFAACAKKWARSPAGALGLLRAWVEGHRALYRDRAFVRKVLEVADRRARLRPVAPREKPCES